MSDRYVVTSQRVAGHLMVRGFVLKGIGDNRKYPGRNVFFFNKTPQLVAAISEYTQTNGGQTNGDGDQAERQAV
ncbi:DUF5659 domain-containing protein [Paenibacillus vini]|uniref:DUF5659 domain-containing protein n=1 Tax=Paenibacillus vini TaxID=1476024 RepID=UPI001BCC19B9|nr:DUF5659 domain-containing protein [Paenibacillus vini]